MQARLVGINISKDKGVSKAPITKVDLDHFGLIGDAHRGRWHRQVSLLQKERIDSFATEHNQDINPGDFAENLIIEGIGQEELNILDILKIGKVELQLTQVGKKCHGNDCAISQKVGVCIMPEKGVFLRVMKPGSMATGDVIEYQPKEFRAKIITMSDRAFHGEYQDISGPTVESRLHNFFRDNKLRYSTSRSILPDERNSLHPMIANEISEMTDVIMITGGTGISKRDIVPDLLHDMELTEIPGIMEFIRVKHGTIIPNALLSRSCAFYKNQSLIFAMPGSVKACNEYMDEIEKVLKHMILMLHGLGH